MRFNLISVDLYGADLNEFLRISFETTSSRYKSKEFCKNSTFFFSGVISEDIWFYFFSLAKNLLFPEQIFIFFFLEMELCTIVLKEIKFSFILDTFKISSMITKYCQCYLVISKYKLQTLSMIVQFLKMQSVKIQRDCILLST